MANIFDYLKWRGDLSWLDDQFNDVDALILSELVYVEFGETVPCLASQDRRRLKDVAADFFRINDETELMSKFSFTKEAILLLKALAKTKRYQDLWLCHYLNEYDYQNPKQFAAITFQLPDSSIFIAYRGTDDTILGWKEDFMMTYTMPIPSQISAAAYLNEISKINMRPSLRKFYKYHKANKSCFKILKQYYKVVIHNVDIRIGGHSKGGNLSVYAACKAKQSISKRILTIYNNDGPGFNEDFLKTNAYQRLATRIIKYVPEACVFGIMLNYLEKIKVVKSDAKGLFQHNGFTWQICGKKFVTCDKINPDSQAMDLAFKNWLQKVDLKTRKEAVASLFSILENAKITKINDFSEKTFSHLIIALKEIKNMDATSRNALIHFFKTLILENSASRKEYHKNHNNS